MLTAKSFVTAKVNRHFNPDFEPPSPSSCCGTRNFLSAIRSRNFDRCHSLNSLILPQAALASLPPARPPVENTAEIDFAIDAYVRIFMLHSDFGILDYYHSFDQRRERYIGEGGSKPGKHEGSYKNSR